MELPDGWEERLQETRVLLFLGGELVASYDKNEPILLVEEDYYIPHDLRVIADWMESKCSALPSS